MGRSSPYCEDMCGRYCCLTSFFPIVDSALIAKIQPVRWCPDDDFFASFLSPVFSASRVQHISDLHSKFALRPHLCQSMVNIQSPTAEIRRGKKKKKKQDETRMWANARPNGRPAEHRWRPLFNAAKFGPRSLLDCRAVTLPRCETR